MIADPYITRVYSNNKHLNDIESKFSQLFLDEHMLANSQKPAVFANSQSLVSLLKPSILKSNSSNEFGLSFPQKNGSAKRKLIKRQVVLPAIKFKKSLARESPYYKERKKKIERTRFSDLMTFNDFVLTAKTMKIIPHETLAPQKASVEPANKNEDRKRTPMSVGPKYWKFFIGEGNNGELVRRVLNETRGKLWREVKEIKGVINLKWQQNTKEFKFERMTTNSLYKQIVNHFEFHREISTKAGLFKNLRSYCEKNSMNISELTPPTFFLELDSDNLSRNIQNFLAFYNKHMPINSKEQRQNTLSLKFQQHLSVLLTVSPAMEDPSAYVKQKMLPVFQDSENYLWLLKPNGLNRGRGIKLFNNLQQLESFLNEYLLSENKPQPTILPSQEISANRKLERMVKSYQPIVKPVKPGFKKVIVIQKYIEKPLLLSGRKFDIRVWSLITHNLDYFFFKEGYIRTSSESFSLNEGEKDNFYIHLTNNAVQKNGKNYGRFEDGNQMSFDDVEKLIRNEGNYKNIRFKEKTIPKMKELIKISLNSVSKKLNKENRKFCFEIFGYDFLIDCEFNVWLIEVNTNPCIETSSKLLEAYIPRMLDDAFKLTVDKVFPAPEDHPLKDTSIYPIPSRSSSENLWEYLGNLSEAF